MLSRQPLSALVALTAILILGIAAGGRAQTATGTILGNVRDKSGGGVPGATITATNLNTHAARSTVSDAEGQYTLPLLPLGTSGGAAICSSTENTPIVRASSGAGARSSRKGCR